MSYTIIDREKLPHDGNTHEFEGSQYQDTELSFIWVDMPHKFRNLSEQSLKQIDIHVSKQFITDWLED